MAVVAGVRSLSRHARDRARHIRTEQRT